MSAESSEETFLSPAEWCDVVLQVEGKKLHFSKAYLAAWSPVFRRMFYGEFRENGKDCITLPKKKLEDIQEMFRCICPMPKMKAVTGILFWFS